MFSNFKDALKTLHDCLKEMPTEKDEEQDPRGLKKNITLFPHQRQGLAWYALFLYRSRRSFHNDVIDQIVCLGELDKIACFRN